MRNDPQVRQVVDQFQLGIPPSPVSGRTGELLGRGSGSSLEFQEHREYLPGDDIRHLDWAAYARTDSLMVRMYREEISPRTQIFLDTSHSMSTGEGSKSRVARQLATAISLMISALGTQPAVCLLGDQRPPRQLQGEEIELLNDLELQDVTDLSQLVDQRTIPLKPQSARILISDFLFPHDARTLIQRLASGSSLFWVIQILTEFEANPSTLGGRRLTDVETGQQADLRINAVTIKNYLERLHRLQESIRGEVVRCGGVFVSLVAEQGLTALCQHDLCRAGILRPK